MAAGAFGHARSYGRGGLFDHSKFDEVMKFVKSYDLTSMEWSLGDQTVLKFQDKFCCATLTF